MYYLATGLLLTYISVLWLGLILFFVTISITLYKFIRRKLVAGSLFLLFAIIFDLVLLKLNLILFIPIITH